MIEKKIKRMGIMFVVSSPSGAGKTTLARQLLKDDKNIELSVSFTTRKKREAEENNKDYIFVGEKVFDNMVKEGKFLEHANVFGNKYGTPRESVLEKLSQGKDILFDIDWQGTQALREKEPKHVVSIFILPPSKNILETRLIARAQDTKEEVKKRMSQANAEITHWPEYDYLIINDDLEKTSKYLKAILIAERLKRNRQTGLNDFVREILLS
tara:strand:+ start:223 stop:858 length:636 start_codon:yes stop_codon:yes gene_type:complete